MALIKELTENGGFPLDSIPATIDEVWHAIFFHAEEQKAEKRDVLHKQDADSYPSIDKRADKANRAIFWQYYISQTLHIALSLIFEDIPKTIAGIILPLERKEHATNEWDSEQVKHFSFKILFRAKHICKLWFARD